VRRLPDHRPQQTRAFCLYGSIQARVPASSPLVGLVHHAAPRFRYWFYCFLRFGSLPRFTHIRCHSEHTHLTHIPLSSHHYSCTVKRRFLLPLLHHLFSPCTTPPTPLPSPPYHTHFTWFSTCPLPLPGSRIHTALPFTYPNLGCFCHAHTPFTYTCTPLPFAHILHVCHYSFCLLFSASTHYWFDFPALLPGGGCTTRCPCRTAAHHL